MQKDLKKYVENFYNINPDNLEDEYIKVVKAFYVFSSLTSESYADQLAAKDELRKVSSMVYLQVKQHGKYTDKSAEAAVNVDPLVNEKKKIYLDKLKKWEEYKGHKETTMLKKEMLVAIGFNRKNDLNVTSHS